MITNLHVFENANSGIVKLDTGAFYTVDEYLTVDEDMDILILKVAGTNLPSIKMGDSSLAKVGDEVFAIGNPKGFQNTISKGSISAIRFIKAKDAKLIQITAPISPGSSGGPLLNANGEVIGITTFLVEGQNLNFAIPIEYAKQLIASSALLKLGEKELKKLENSATFSYIGGILSEDAGNLDQAIKFYKEAIRIDPKSKEPYYNLENLYYKKRMYTEQVTVNENLTRLFPQEHYAYHTLGISYEAVGKENSAIESYKKAIALKPNFADSIDNLGFLYILIGDISKAKVQVDNLKKLNPHFASQLERLINILEKSQKTK